MVFNFAISCVVNYYSASVVTRGYWTGSRLDLVKCVRLNLQFSFKVNKSTWVRCYEFLNIFAKKLAKKMAFLTHNKAKLCKKLIITGVFEKTVSQKIVENRRKLSKIAENCRKSQKIVKKSQKIVIITSAPRRMHSWPCYN
jgi:hypothetical protein